MKRILIVDDDKDTLDVFTEILSPLYEIQAVGSRDEALAAINTGFAPACVLMDYRMPGMTLEDFLEKSKLHDLQIVLMTAYADAVKVSELHGLSSSLQKPIPPELILKVLKSIVGE